MGNTNWLFFFFFFLVGERSKGLGQTWEDWEVCVIRVDDIKFENNEKFYRKKRVSVNLSGVTMHPSRVFNPLQNPVVMLGPVASLG